MLSGGTLLLAGAAVLMRAKATGASEIATAGGLAAIAAGVLGVVIGEIVGVTSSISSLLGESRSSTAGSGSPLLQSRAQRLHLKPHVSSSLIPAHATALQSFGWDLYLLVVSLGLVWVGSRARSRGLGYVGGFGLLAFIFSIGLEVTRVEYGHASTHSILGWPLALLLLGIAALAVPSLWRDRGPAK